ncbi:hypothetical protein BDV06DRAFT_233181 [Aspergillus oleicola]
MATPFTAVAGATGALGHLIALELRNRNAEVKALVRPGTDSSRVEELRKAGVVITPVDLSDLQALTRELNGAKCVVSVLQGLKDVMHTTQGNLLDAAVAAKVPRFIPSDFSLDFTKTELGSNRNLDLRREFHDRLNESGINWTTILNGGFMDLLGGDAPLLNHYWRRVPYVGSAEQLLDFTTMRDTAAYTAAVAQDHKPTPRILRIAGDVVSMRDIAEVASEIEGAPYTATWMGTVGFVRSMIWGLRIFGGEDQVFPVWQRMQYMANSFSGDGKLEPLDNGRYPEVKWTKVVDYLRQSKLERSGS